MECQGAELFLWSSEQNKPQKTVPFMNSNHETLSQMCKNKYVLALEG